MNSSTDRIFVSIKMFFLSASGFTPMCFWLSAWEKDHERTIKWTLGPLTPTDHISLWPYNLKVFSGHLRIIRNGIILDLFHINCGIKHFLSRCIWNVSWPTLSWISALPTGSASFWEPSCWLLKFGMTRLCGMLTTVRSLRTSQWRTCEFIFCKFEKFKGLKEFANWMEDTSHVLHWN